MWLIWLQILIVHFYILTFKGDYMKNTKNKGIGLFFIGVLVSMLILQIVIPNDTFSSLENRTLQTHPEYNLDQYKTGDFQDQYSHYISDQFPMRSSWVKKKTAIEEALGVRKFQDVYLAKDKSLIQEMAPVDPIKITATSEAINNFSERYNDLKMSSLIVPNKVAINKEKLPKYAPVIDQLDIINDFHETLNIDVVDVVDVFMEHKDEYLYYSTDHHWTSLGAKYAFDKFIQEDKGIIYQPYIANDQFYGTLSNKIGYFKKPDTITLPIPENDDTKVVVKIGDEDQKTSIYDATKQSSYEVFLGGNYPRLDITTTTSNQEHLLIFKDSYANSFIPYLLPYYHKITLIDPRYYYDEIDQLMEEENITEVLFLYNANTFFNDSSLIEVLK